jgi:hypothetical protein
MEGSFVRYVCISCVEVVGGSTRDGCVRSSRVLIFRDQTSIPFVELDAMKNVPSLFNRHLTVRLEEQTAVR